jgi:hypothetical protein
MAYFSSALLCILALLGILASWRRPQIITDCRVQFYRGALQRAAGSSFGLMGLPFWDWFIIALALLFVAHFTAMMLGKGPRRQAQILHCPNTRVTTLDNLLCKAQNSFRLT